MMPNLNLNDKSLVRPTLSLVIADDHAGWSEKLQSLAEHLRQWSFTRTGQIALSVHVCQSAEGFENLVDSLLSAGDVVYATLDLKMPLVEGEEIASTEAGERLIDLCLQWKRQEKRLEFCLVSDLAEYLDRLYRVSSELRKQGTRRVHKSAILGSAGQQILLDVAVDIQSFARRHLSFCAVELPPRSGEKAFIWFGGNEQLLDLLNQADHIASADAGVYILLAEAGGFEIDWVKLCCELRGVDLSDLDVAAVDPIWHPEWKTHFQNPPPALLVRNLDQANDRGCDIAPLLEKEKFFDRAVALKSLVFFQFPLLETKLDISKLDEAIEAPIFEACLQHIYQSHSERPHQPSRSFSVHEDRRIIVFPSYAILKSAGVLRKTIELQMIESSRHAGCDGISIDPELLELLAEIPWNERGGIHQLRRAIQYAYRNFAARGRRERFISQADFQNSFVADDFASALGFLVRGRRLYRLFEGRDAVIPGSGIGRQEENTSQRVLQSLESLWEIYDGLERLRRLRDELGLQLAVTGDFTFREYETLAEVWQFFRDLFNTPEELRGFIEKFRLFSWPLKRFLRRPEVEALQRLKELTGNVDEEVEQKLLIYPDLRNDWKESEHRLRVLSEDILGREWERIRAESYIRESHSQPVYVHLVPRTKKGGPQSSFQTILSSFLIFNSLLAVSENRYTFGGSLYDEKKAIAKGVQNPQLGAKLGFLCRYTEELRSSGEIERSIFNRWTEHWAERGSQRYAVRLARHLAHDMLNAPEYKDGWQEEERTVFSRLADATEQSCSTGTVLDFFLKVRNSYIKRGVEKFERSYGSSLLDLLRRFLVATTAAYRFGRIDGEEIRLWRKDVGVQSEVSAACTYPSIWQNRIVVAREIVKGDSFLYEALFPVDEYIRVHPDHGSVWALDGRRWLNLTCVGGSPEQELLSPDKADWLLGGAVTKS